MEKFEPINVVLTDEQIVALPTTPVELVPAKKGQQIIPCLGEEKNIVGYMVITTDL